MAYGDGDHAPALAKKTQAAPRASPSMSAEGAPTTRSSRPSASRSPTDIVEPKPSSFVVPPRTVSVAGAPVGVEGLRHAGVGLPVSVHVGGG